MSAKPLRLDLIRLDGDTQPRAEIDETTVAEYAEAMEAGAEFPPVVVFHDGAAHWLADGFHRYHAMRRVGLTACRPAVHRGTRRDAILYSVGSNHQHGLRRNSDDKKKAIRTLLRDAEWGVWSDNKILGLVGASGGYWFTFVAAERRSLLPEEKSEQTAARTFTTRHGTVATMDTSNIGRRAPAPSGPTDEELISSLYTESEGDGMAEAAPAEGASVRKLQQYRADHERVSTYITGNLNGAEKAMAAMLAERRVYPTVLESALEVAEEEEIAGWIGILSGLIGTARKLQQSLREGSGS